LFERHIDDRWSGGYVRAVRFSMANVKKGQLTAPPEWWKHLRWTKRVFWKAERKAGKEEAWRQQENGYPVARNASASCRVGNRPSSQ
jgi:hypothetical protein